jgi:hypothetical protein
VRTLEGHRGEVRAVAYRPDGQQLASGADDGTLRLWEVGSGKLLGMLRGHTSTVLSLSWYADGQRIASASEDGTIRIWDAASGQCLATLYQFEEGGWLAVTPDGRYTGNEVGKRHVTFAHGWALYPAEVFPEFEDPDAVRAALSPQRHAQALIADRVGSDLVRPRRLRKRNGT